MLIGLCHVIVIAVVVWAVVTGYRKGFLHLTGDVVAVAFGIVTVRLAADSLSPYVDEWLSDAVTGFKRRFVVDTLTCGGLYVAVYFLISLAARPVGKIISTITGGVLNSISGAVFNAFQYLVLVSIAYNLIVDFNPTGSLCRSSRQHDGNLVEAVIKIAPAVLGFPGGEDVAHFQQLEDAKKIS